MKRIIIFILVTLISTSMVSAQTNRAYKKGYQGCVEVGNYAVFGKDKYGGMPQISTTQGYKTGTGIYLGVGAGVAYELVEDIPVFPFFLDAKYNFADTKVSPCIAARTGLRVSYDYLAPFLSVAGGVDAGRFTIKVGYEYSSARMQEKQYANGYGNVYLGTITTYRKPSQLFCSFAVNF